MSNIDNYNIHHEYTHRFVNDVVCGSGLLKAEDCPCEDCRKIKEANQNLIHRALSTSSRMTAQQLGQNRPGYITGCYCPNCIAEDTADQKAKATSIPLNTFSVNEESYRWKR